MRKMSRWTPIEGSPVYWLVLWGMSNKEVVELTQELLPERSYAAINSFAVDVRKFISEVRGFTVEHPVTDLLRSVIRASSKISPHDKIKDLRPENLHSVKFVPAGTHVPVKRKIVSPNYEQLKEGEINKHVNYAEAGVETELNVGNHKIKYKNGIATGAEEIPFPKTEPSKVLVFDGEKVTETTLRVEKEKSVKEYTLESVLEIAKSKGAKKVHWNGYTIKF